MTPEELEQALHKLGLSRFASVMAAAFVHRQASTAESSLPHVLSWLHESLVAPADGWPHSVLHPPLASQRGCPEIVPGLTSRPLWHASPYAATSHSVVAAAVDLLESSTDAIRAELLALRGIRGFQAYRSPTWSADDGDADGRSGTSSGDWSVYYLQLHNQDCSARAARCPATMAVLERLGSRAYGHSLFSAMSPGTRITPHTGPTNRKLRLQLPLVVPPGGHSRLTVAGQEVVLEEGKVVVFDDSHVHAAAHTHETSTRIILIVDIWHPDLTDAEVKVLSYIRGAQLRAAKAMSGGAEADASRLEHTHTRVDARHDFFAVLDAAERRGMDDARVFGDAAVDKARVA